MTTINSNALRVVEAWRTGDHSSTWNEPAKSMPPSQTNRLVASAFGSIAAAADNAADHLRRNGFQPGHPTMRRLREIASEAAREHQRAIEWADALADAEAVTQ